VRAQAEPALQRERRREQHRQTQHVAQVAAHDEAPSAREWLGHWALWSFCFELAGPALPLLAPGAVRDPLDVVAYGAGGVVAACWWRARAGSRQATSGPRRVFARACVAGAVAGFVLSAYGVRAIWR
jgi:hypothetical protein